MILNLKHYSFFKNKGDKWIYFGPSYLKLHTLEKNTSKNVVKRQGFVNFFSRKKQFARMD